ncbi:hypothetical protein OG897_35470 [Streptomyces sp. NBC_00237]|uniref:hypothetical protein n=1 Tax=Streptomyces sp. NBC_00237 TaxID=2975687 RepID=UPI00225811E5|nr:hypothetical protein [Streptomyces sp. NBC_00237]MCX5206691.1 hypothetical protein [Streptomyces sp. NBC_00237]
MNSTPIAQRASAPSRYLEGLAPTPRNIISAVRAFARIDEIGWAARGGYPGSDVLWEVTCMVDGWQGLRFYSHLRRNKPIKRHQGCAAAADHPRALAALGAYATGVCTCRAAHPTTVPDVVAAFDAIDRTWRLGTPAALERALGRLLDPCPAIAVRAQAVTDFASLSH